MGKIEDGTEVRVVCCEDMPSMKGAVGKVFDDTYDTLGDDPNRYIPVRFPNGIVAFRLNELAIIDDADRSADSGASE